MSALERAFAAALGGTPEGWRAISTAIDAEPPR